MNTNQAALIAGQIADIDTEIANLRKAQAGLQKVLDDPIIDINDHLKMTWKYSELAYKIRRLQDERDNRVNSDPEMFFDTQQDFLLPPAWPPFAPSSA